MARRRARRKTRIPRCECDAASIFLKEGEIRLSLCKCSGMAPTQPERMIIGFTELIK